MCEPKYDTSSLNSNHIWKYITCTSMSLILNRYAYKIFYYPMYYRYTAKNSLCKNIYDENRWHMVLYSRHNPILAFSLLVSH